MWGHSSTGIQVCVKFLRRVGLARYPAMDERTVPPLEGGTAGGWLPRHAQPPLNPLLRKEGKPVPLGIRKNLTGTPGIPFDTRNPRCYTRLRARPFISRG